jgi:hypothetical protein
MTMTTSTTKTATAGDDNCTYIYRKVDLTRCGMSREQHRVPGLSHGFVSADTPPPPAHDAGLREGEHDIKLTYEEIDGKHVLFEGNLLVAVVGECLARSEYARTLAQEIKLRVNTHAALVRALEGLMSRFEQTGEAWMSDPAWIAASEALRQARGGE